MKIDSRALHWQTQSEEQQARAIQPATGHDACRRWARDRRDHTKQLELERRRTKHCKLALDRRLSGRVRNARTPPPPKRASPSCCEQLRAGSAVTGAGPGGLTGGVP
jgi:hypothetical protein